MLHPVEPRLSSRVSAASEWRETPLLGPLSAALLFAAQRNSNAVVNVAGAEYAVGMAAIGSRVRLVLHQIRLVLIGC